MAHGIEVFREHFSAYKEQYTVIGGMACDLLMSDAGLDFRLTQDIDMVLIIEALTTDFGKAIWQFIEDGDYTTHLSSIGQPKFYRFVNPTNPAYPKMIELFSRPQSGVQLQAIGHLMPLHIDDEITSLSAILLNDSYYKFLLAGRAVAGDVSVLDAVHIIPLKMKAWLDLTDRKARGAHVNDRDLRKHRQDVFRLFPLINAANKIPAPVEVYNDIQICIQKMRTLDIDLAAIHITRSKETMLDVYEQIYIAESSSMQN